ncbi:hypothetical protein GCM10010448_68510 [Streptomyces glomeratus]|uniref:Uncharacterized protein n=1 Tax=Streptomyces glomeratus TaxID=284452 RepID=A0ABP6M4B0_9ACTN
MTLRPGRLRKQAFALFPKVPGVILLPNAPGVTLLPEAPGVTLFPMDPPIPAVPHCTNVRHVTDVPRFPRTGHGFPSGASDAGSCQV